MYTSRTATSRRIVVVGAGVVGASVAHHLVRAGHEVVVLDSGYPAGGVTGASFAWVGLAKSSADVHTEPLRARAMAEFDRVVTEISAPIGLRRCGAITWEEDDSATNRFVAAHQDAGHRMEHLSGPELSVREPALVQVPSTAAFAPDDLGVDPVAYTRSLLQSAQQSGAVFRAPTQVIALLTDDDRARGALTDHGEITAESVVLAAGTGSTRLAQMAGVHVDVAASPCCLLTFSTPRPLVRSILSTPDFEVRQLDDNTLLAAEDVPLGFSGDPAEIASTTLEALQSHLYGANELRLKQAVIADRPMPTGGRPLVGPAPGVPGLYLAVAHPAVILSAAIGSQVASDHTL